MKGQRVAIELRNLLTTIKAANDAADATDLQRIQSDLETLMLRHGRGRIIGICVEAIRSAEFRGAKW